jgi:fused signal recognition particle receptor
MPIGFFKNIIAKFTGKPVDWDELEETLIRADLGVPMSMKILHSLRSRDKQLTTNDIIEVTREEVAKVLPFDPAPLRPFPNRPKVILVVGVNGTGKTTSTAKLAHLLKKRRHSVTLVAADTFRAAAIEQLAVWSERIGVEMIKGQYNADPAALCYDAYVAADKRNIEFLVCDTAGRLHTKINLMAELNKIKRTLAKHDESAPHECLLVVDATTGSNALQQAREFDQSVKLTGVIVTKLDGSGKGGVVIAIQNELNIPTRFIGTGEKLDDFAPFDARQFIEQML